MENEQFGLGIKEAFITHSMRLPVVLAAYNDANIT